MAAHGPEEFQIIEDSNGNKFQYSESQFLGQGVGGKVYRAKVVAVGPGIANLEVGQEVALKSLIPSNDSSDRELELQKREGTLYTTITQNEGSSERRIILVQPIFPGVDLRNALYLHRGPEGHLVPVAFNPISNERSNSLLAKLENDELTDQDKEEIAILIAGSVEYRIMNHIILNDITNIENKLDALRVIVKTFADKKLNNNAREQIAANFLRMQPLLIALAKDEPLTDDDKALIRKQIRDNTALTNVERDSIAYSLIRDYFAIQQLGIVHCDIKPDNILVDRQSRTAKIIDMGQAFLISQNPHGEFQGPGIMYSAPEGNSVNRETTSNSIRTDMYGLGIIIASMYSANAYEVGVRDVDNSQLASRAVLSDVLDAKNVPGMPDDLLQIVKHITQINPEDRPPNIALANGIKESPQLSHLHDMQEDCMAYAYKMLSELKPKLKERVDSEIGNSDDAKDLPTLLKILQSVKASSNSKTTKKELTIAIDSIQQYIESQVQNLQKSREAAIQDRKGELGSTHYIAAQLRHEASKYRIPQKRAFFGVLAKQASDFHPEGRMLESAAHQIEKLDTNRIDEIQEILEKTYHRIESIPLDAANEKAVSERHSLLSSIERLNDSLNLKSSVSDSKSNKKVRF